MWFTGSLDEVLGNLGSSRNGLSREEASIRFDRFGPNVLPEPPLQGLLLVFVRQFLNPFIYILLFAAIVSLILREWSDAIFIVTVVSLNAIIGTVQESRAERSARALRQFIATTARVVRGGDVVEIDAKELVPGDVIELSSGDKVPADVRLLESYDFQTDESLLTGESLPVAKQERVLLGPEVGLAERVNMAFAGTLVTRGRSSSVVVTTGMNTEIGSMASDIAAMREPEAPLLLRMRRFSHRVAAVMVGVAVVFASIEASRGRNLGEVALVAIALAVSAIPEGLPVALTVALAIGMRRMAQRHVIVRRMAAVESLGSCTVIASDKTGTLTVNELTVTTVVLPGLSRWLATGVGTVPVGNIEPVSAGDWNRLEEIRALARSGVLCNEASLVREDSGWSHHGDALDVSLLVFAHKMGITQYTERTKSPLLDERPFESELRFAATLHLISDEAGMKLSEIHAKGAVEMLLPMCAWQRGPEGDEPIDASAMASEAEELADEGFRVIAVAYKMRSGTAINLSRLHDDDLSDMTLLGLVAMIDPARPDAAESIRVCRDAGLRVIMVTGDHPSTALAIARQVGIAADPNEVVTGSQLRHAVDEDGKDLTDLMVGRGTVFARVEPSQKLAIVESLIRQGEIVAVTGDGANDAAALQQAHVGVAMGKSGTDVAREAADLIITDDAFASIAAGVEEGRIAYGNVRKVISLLVSTGAGEVVLFLLALAVGLPAPLTAVQLLWLNLVTNGIQDIALAFEPAEGTEMNRPPRLPTESIFNRLMLERVSISAVVIGISSFMLYRILLGSGWDLFSARNAVTAQMVLLENVLVLNSRSETRLFVTTWFRGNRFLVLGVLVALGVHICAMHFAPTQGLLSIEALPAHLWALLTISSVGLFAIIEGHKMLWVRLEEVRQARSSSHSTKFFEKR